MATEKFHFDIPGTKKKITLPHFDSVKPGVIRKVRKEGDTQVFFTVLEALADEKTLAVIDEFDKDTFSEFAKAWQEASKTSTGESSAS